MPRRFARRKRRYAGTFTHDRNRRHHESRDVVLVERRLRAGVLPYEVVDGVIRIPLADVTRRRAEEDCTNALLLEISRTFEEVEK